MVSIRALLRGHWFLLALIATMTEAGTSPECHERALTPVHLQNLIAEKSEREIIDTLRCADNSETLINQHRLLHVAVANNFSHLLEWATRRNADVEQVHFNGMTPVMVAAQQGNLKMVNLLLTAGASPSVKAPNGYGAFDFALENNHRDVMSSIVAFHLSSSADNEKRAAMHPHNKVSLALSHAILNGDWSRLNALIDNETEINGHNITNYAPLPLAVRLGEERIVRLLLEHGANPNIGNDGNDEAIPLNQATRGNRIELARLLLSSGADVNKENGRGYSALMLASMYGHRDFVSFLLKNGARIEHLNHKGSDALMLAAAMGHAAIVDDLLAAGITHDRRNSQGFSALDYAIQRNHENTVYRLIVHAEDKATADFVFSTQVKSSAEADTSLHHQKVLGYPLLNLAARFAKHATVKSLLQKGANPEIQAETGYKTNALMSACQSGDVDTVKLLLAHGVNVNAQDGHGDPAINWATAYGYEEIVHILLGAGADPRIANKEGYTAIRTARERGMEALAEVMETFHSPLALYTESTQ